MAGFDASKDTSTIIVGYSDMRYALFSDIHGNAGGLADFLATIAAKRIDRLICLGDLLERGHNAREDSVVSMIRQMGSVDVVRGNHDSRHSVEGGMVSEENLNFLDTIPEYRTFGDAIAFHSSLREPGAYLFGLEDIQKEYDYIRKNVGEYGIHLFGHVHESGAYLYSKRAGRFTKMNDRQKMCLKPGNVYFVNPGSLCLHAIGGQKYSILDMNRRTLSPKRLRNGG